MTDELVEALYWLRNNKNRHSAFAGNRFNSTEEAIEAVRELYSAGARRVDIVVQFEEPERIQRDGGAYSETMVVHGDTKGEEQLFCAIGALLPDETQYKRTDFSWLLWWD